MKFKELLTLIGDDLKAYANGRTSFMVKVAIFFTNPGFHLLANYRISFYLKDTYLSPLNIFIRYINNVLMSSEISPYAQLGRNIQFPHPNGIVIGYGTIVYDNVVIFQQVTLGAQGRNQSNEKLYPIIGTGVKIYAKASVIGSVRVADNCTIGAHCLVLKDTDANSVYVGIPASKVCHV